MRAAILGCAVVGLLGLAAVAASLHGSPLQPGAAEQSDLPSVLFLAAAGSGFALYVAALFVLRRRGPRLAIVCAIAAAIQLVPLAGPLILSRDVYAYWAYGRIVEEHDSNPYSVPPARFSRDPAVQAMAPAWRNTKSVYGPLFTTASAGLAKATGDSAETTAFTYRLLAALGMIALVGLAAVAAPLPAFGVAFVGWNPLLALDFAGGGHNDVWMAVFVLGALALAARGRPRLAGASWALAAGLKWVPLALLPLSLLAARGRGAIRLAIGFFAGASAIAASAFVLFGTAWLSAIVLVAQHRAHWAIPSRFAELGLPRWIALAPLVLALPWLAREAWRGRPRLGAASALLLLASPWLLPWYAVWAVPLAAVEEDRVAWVLALGLSAYLLPDRVPI